MITRTLHHNDGLGLWWSYVDSFVAVGSRGAVIAAAVVISSYAVPSPAIGAAASVDHSQSQIFWDTQN